MGLRSEIEASKRKRKEERREALGKVIEQTTMREIAVMLDLPGGDPVPWESQPQSYRESYRRVADAALAELGLS